MNSNDEKKIIILCGPSGSGKTTLAQHLLQRMPELRFSISATTREKRTQENHGIDYYFLTVEDFTKRITDNEFVEFEEVYNGLFYGTLKSELHRIWNDNQIPLLDIDVIGALNIKQQFAPQALSIFVHPISLENIQKRLKKRATENETSFQKRTQKAALELEKAEMFDKIIYNDNLESACMQAEELIYKYISKSN